MSNGTVSVMTPSDREVVVTRTFDAPRELVFEAHTNPELVRRWLLGPPGWTMPVCDIDLRVGGHYRYVWSGPDGASLALGGVFREVVPPKRLVSKQRFDEDWTGGETINTIELTESDGTTTLTLTVLHASKEARDGALATGMTQGLDAGYARLDDLLVSTADGGG